MMTTEVQQGRTAEDPLMDGFATVREGAAFLRLSRAKVYQLMESKELLYAKFGGSRRIPWRSLYDYAARSIVG
jgi:excisionase family DNA binding protein